MSILQDSNIVVAISFLCFVGVLIYVGVPKILGGALDKRAEKIQDELDEARRLREEAQSLLASYERKAKEVEGHTEAIVAQARAEAERAAEDAKAALAASIERRLKGAADRIASAEAAAVKEVKDRAVAIAVDVAGEIMREKMTLEQQTAMIDASIKDVGAKLH